MTKFWKLTVAAFLALGIPSSAHAEFKAGFAFRVVTPDPLLPISGGIGPSSPAKEKRGDLTVRAVVMEQGETRVAIVSADFLGFPKTLGDKVRSRISVIPPDHVLIGATHTHSAPDCYGFPDGKGGFACDVSYLERVVKQMAESIQEAFDQRKPASVKIATGEARGKIAYNYYAPDLYDPRCHVIQIVALDGTPQVTLVNYAVHPEILGNNRGFCSPDLIGPLYDRVAEKAGGQCIFMNSAQGGMVTADVRRPDGTEANSWDECIRIGNLLAEEALRIVQPATIQQNPPLEVFSRPVRFPVDSPLLLAIMKSSPLGYHSDEQSVTTTINLINLGDSQILTIPGEALPNIGFYLKRKMRGANNLLFGLTNDAFGYILTPVDWSSFSRYDYVSRTSLGERTGDILINESLALIKDSPTPGAR